MAIDSQIWHQHALANRIQSLLLLVAMVSFLSLLGWVLWGVDGIFWLLLLGFVLLLFNPVASPWLIMRMYRATRLTSVKAPTLDSTLRELAHRAGLHRVPELFYVPSPMVNAFTVGSRNEAVIAVTDGLLRSLDTRETVGVLAHEVSHIRNNDMWVMGMADLFSRLTSLLSLLGQFLLLLNLPLIVMSNVSINWFAILLLIFAPNLSALAQLGLSRTREYEADLSAARLTGDPEGLANALVKIEQRSGSLLERLFLPGRRIPEPSLLRTHPPTKERVRR
ncbi:peptidase M48 Ste24p [endosymbiont of Riftia pachyptila (vent Ph05)]|uniref:Peptidase M48 Ste24p n=2 Tax=endosymbiont of Riftia pachyptila TaxID=54396 RepID=G2DEU7_9GAMM|nr:peptidase M48 Ste24p [endosymbiont of Riftia pachyptila (vent Ph05)]